MSNFRRRLMSVLQNKPLYTELEYLESTNTTSSPINNWIDTGVKSSSDLKFEIEYEALRYSDNVLFGGRDVHYSTQIVFNYYSESKFLIRWKVENPNLYLYDGYGELNKKYKLNMSREGLYINDNLIYNKFDQRTFDASDLPGNITLFAFNNLTTNSNIVTGQHKIYYCKIWKNDELIRDFIPVLDSKNVPCMYDKVEKKFYYNQGMEDFLYKRKIPDGVTEIEYLESTGSEYIDTGYIVNVNNYDKTRFVVDTNILGSVSGYAFNGIGNASINAFLVGERLNDIKYGVGNEISTSINYNNNRVIFDLDAKNNKYTVFDTVTEEYLVNLNKLVTNNKGFDETQSLLILFGYLRASFPTGEYQRLHKAQIYNCKIYEEEKLVREFVPVLDKNKIPCMYDKIEGKFYYNEGNGQFQYGLKVV